MYTANIYSGGWVALVDDFYDPMSVELYRCLRSDVNMKNKQYSFSYSNHYFLSNIMEKHPLA